MRRNLIIWLALFIISVILISFYGGTVSYGIFTVLAAAPVVSLIYILFVIMRFGIYQKIDGHSLVANRRSDFYFTLQNESLMTFVSIRILFYSDHSEIDGLNDATEYELAPHSGIRKQTGIICRYRGEYEVGIRKITVTYPLRLFCISYNNREPLRVRVKPDIVHLEGIRTPSENLSSAGDSRRNATQPDVLVRDYTTGDDQRMIHWRASAATGRLMVRKLTGIERSGVGIIMDSTRPSLLAKEYIPAENKMLECMIALTLFFCSRNTSVGISCGNYTAVVDDMAGFEDFYEQMCRFDFDKEGDRTAECGKSLSRPVIADRKDVYYLTWKWDKVSYDFANELIRCGMSVNVCIIGRESDAAYKAYGINMVSIPPDSSLTEVL